MVVESSERGRVCVPFPSGLVGSVWLVAVLVLGGCGGQSDSQGVPTERTSTTVSQTVASPEPGTSLSTRLEPEAAPPTTVEPESLPSATVRAALSSEEIYGLVAPSIPVVETPVGTGSGILVEGGLVVTNYHVVWPYERVRVVFPDGTEFADVPVLAWDAFADLALLGPVDVSLPYLDLSDGEGMPPGSEVYLIGYPAETDLFPEPSITRGVLSRFWEWELYALTLLQMQTHADIVAGQSGGAMVNSFGEVVGVSTWYFGDVGLTVATSAADDVEILRALIEDNEEFGPWGVPSGGTGATEFVVDLENSLDSGRFMFEGEAGSIVDIRIEGPSEGVLGVVSPSGGLVPDVDDAYWGLDHWMAELAVDGPYVVVLYNRGDTLGEAASFTLESNVPLVPLIDPDDGQELSVGGLVAGVIDHSRDHDWFSIELFEGETVVFWTEAIATDTAVYVGRPGWGFPELVWGDSRRPLFGIYTNAELVFTAPTTGRYYVGVNDPLPGAGAYFLGVDYAEPAAEGGVGGSGVGVEPTLGLLFDLDDDTHWGELFEAFAPAERDCIREELGDGALLEGVLASTVLGGDFEEETRGVFRCLHHDTAMELLIAVMVVGAAEEQVFFEPEHVTCLREVFSREEGAALFAATFSETVPEEDIGEAAFDFMFCLPEEFWGGPSGAAEPVENGRG